MNKSSPIAIGILTALGTFAAPLSIADESTSSAAAANLVPLDIFSVPDDLEVTLWAQSPQLKIPRTSISTRRDEFGSPKA